MELVIKNEYLETKTINGVQSVHVEVQRCDGKIYYFVIVTGKYLYSWVSNDCAAAYLDAESALFLSDQIETALKHGKDKLEVKI